MSAEEQKTNEFEKKICGVPSCKEKTPPTGEYCNTHHLCPGVLPGVFSVECVQNGSRKPKAFERCRDCKKQFNFQTYEFCSKTFDLDGTRDGKTLSENHCNADRCTKRILAGVKYCANHLCLFCHGRKSGEWSFCAKCNDPAEDLVGGPTTAFEICITPDCCNAVLVGGGDDVRTALCWGCKCGCGARKSKWHLGCRKCHSARVYVYSDQLKLCVVCGEEKRNPNVTYGCPHVLWCDGCVLDYRTTVFHNETTGARMCKECDWLMCAYCATKARDRNCVLCRFSEKWNKKYR